MSWPLFFTSLALDIRPSRLWRWRHAGSGHRLCSQQIEQCREFPWRCPSIDWPSIWVSFVWRSWWPRRMKCYPRAWLLRVICLLVICVCVLINNNLLKRAYCSWLSFCHVAAPWEHGWLARRPTATPQFWPVCSGWWAWRWFWDLSSRPFASEYLQQSSSAPNRADRSSGPKRPWQPTRHQWLLEWLHERQTDRILEASCWKVCFFFGSVKRDSTVFFVVKKHKKLIIQFRKQKKWKKKWRRNVSQMTLLKVSFLIYLF